MKRTINEWSLLIYHEVAAINMVQDFKGHIVVAVIDVRWGKVIVTRIGVVSGDLTSKNKKTMITLKQYDINFV